MNREYFKYHRSFEPCSTCEHFAVRHGTSWRKNDGVCLYLAVGVDGQDRGKTVNPCGYGHKHYVPKSS